MKENEIVVVLCVHGEAGGRLLVVQMLQEAIKVSAIQDGESVINVAFPDLRFAGLSSFCLLFEIHHV